MTGEITLTGKVLPVGGIKEKILAAKRANITDIMLSRENLKDIQEINEIYLKGVKFHYVSNLMEILSFALLKQKVKSDLTLSKPNPDKKTSD
jgi:ATP-dependent Lon protease